MYSEYDPEDEDLPDSVDEDLEADQKQCVDCGQWIHEDAEICPACGAFQVAASTRPAPWVVVVAVLLLIGMVAKLLLNLMSVNKM